MIRYLVWKKKIMEKKEINPFLCLVYKERRGNLKNNLFLYLLILNFKNISKIIYVNTL